MSKPWEKINKFLLYFFFFLLPWQAVFIWQEKFLNGAKWQYGSLVFYASEILLWLIVLGELFLLIKNWKKIELPLVKEGRLGLVSIIWLLVGWSLLSGLWAADGFLSFFVWLKLALAAVLFFLVLNKLNFKKLSWILLATAVLQALLAAGQFFIQEIIGNKWLGIIPQVAGQPGALVIETFASRFLRATGSFLHPNVLAIFLALSFLLGLNLYLNAKEKKAKAILLAVLMIITLGLFVSFSRAAWLVLGVAVLFWLAVLIIKKRPWQKFLLASLWALLFFIILALIYQPLILNRFDLNSRLEAKSISERAIYNNQAQAMIKNHFWRGVGWANYTLALQKKDNSQPAWAYQPVHNVYLLVWSELGLIGLALWLLLLCFLLRQIKLGENQGLGLALFALIFLAGFFDHYFLTQYIGIMIFWLILALIIKSATHSAPS